MRRDSTKLASAFFAVMCLSGCSFIQVLRAQTQLDESGQTTIVRPGACPGDIHGGLFGFFFGYEHAGYSWASDWQLKTYLDPVDHARATYVPAGDPFYINSRDGRARWYHPAFIARCQIFEEWFFGRLVRSTIDIRVETNLGEVKECGGGTSMTLPAEYDPYEPADPYGEDGCTTYTGGGGGSGSGTQYQPGDSTGGETVDWETGVGNGGTSACGYTSKVEWVCIDTWNDVSKKWDTFACGFATTC
jgi:hypothetical protein